MKYCDFELLPEYVVNGKIHWNVSGNGEICMGTKNGRTFIIKRNLHIRYPSKDLPKAVYEAYLAPALLLQKKQEKLRKLMKGLDYTKDGIVVEEENFWDTECMFTTVTAFIPDCLPGDYDFTRISQTEFIELAKNLMQRLEILHSRKVIHGDLKEKNVLVKKNSAGKYETYLIDFDTSYPTDEIPEFDLIGGTNGYQSPENLAYGTGSDEFTSDIITPATDVFTAAIVMHKWWTGAFPSIDLEKGCVGVAVYLEDKVDINSKFNVKIGPKCGATLISLINWMFAKEGSDRPTATQAIAVLNDEIPVPEKYHKGSDEKMFDVSLWDIHSLLISILSEEELRKLGVTAFKRVNEGKGNAGLKYKVVGADGAEKTLDVDGLVAEGYAKKKDAEIEAPWSEHEIEFEPADVIAAKGYIRIRKANQLYSKRYNITLKSGIEIDKSREWLISEGLAHLIVRSDVVTDTPWPEHGTEYNLENMAHFKIISISRVEIGGEHRYKLVYDIMVDGAPKVNDKVSGNNMKLMGLIK